MQLTKKELQKVLKSRLFSEIAPTVAASVFSEPDCYALDFSDGENLLSPETEGNKICILLAGKATATTPDPTHQTLLRFLSPDEPFGIANLFGGQPYISVVRAHGACRAFFISERAIARLLEADRSFLYHYIGFLSDRIRFLNRKIGYLTAGSAERRLALYLLSFDSCRIHLTESISSLSDLLNLGRASLYRAFDRLTEDGFLIKSGRELTLTDPDGMLKAYR